MSKEASEEYASSLADLTINSKPLINMLTILAEENIDHAPAIVQTVETHLQKVKPDIKLPVLYLVDSIVKNVGAAYTSLFTQNIVSTFCSVFEKVDERTRGQMFKLRQTWNEVFPPKKLYALDVRAKATTVTAPSAPSKAASSKGAALKETPTKVDPPKTDSKTDPSSADPNKLTYRSEILNPPSLSVKKVVLNKELVSKEELLKGPKLKAKKDKEVFTPDKTGPYAGLNEAQMREVLLVKQKQYLEMQQKKLEHELLRTKAKLEEQQRQLEKQTGNLHAAGKVQELQMAPLKDLETKPIDMTVAIPLLIAKFEDCQTTNSSDISTKEPPKLSISHTTPAVASKWEVKKPVAASTTAQPAVRSRDPRLASRQPPPADTNEHNKTTNFVFDSIKMVEPAKPRQQIKINLANPDIVNKVPKGASRKDPRLKGSKVHGLSNNSSKEALNNSGRGEVKKSISPPSVAQGEKLLKESGKLGKGENADLSDSNKGYTPSRPDIGKKKRKDSKNLGENATTKNTKRDDQRNRSPFRAKSPVQDKIRAKSPQRSKSPLQRTKSPIPKRKSPVQKVKSHFRLSSPVQSSKSPPKPKSPIHSKSPVRESGPFQHLRNPPRSSSPIFEESLTEKKLPFQRTRSPIGSKSPVYRTKSPVRGKSPSLISKSSNLRSKSPVNISISSVASNSVQLDKCSNLRSTSPFPGIESTLPIIKSPDLKEKSPIPRVKSPVVEESLSRKKSPEGSRSPGTRKVASKSKTASEEIRPVRDSGVPSKYENSGSDLSRSPSPEKKSRKKSRSKFKDVKTSRKTRHYRERASSKSPDLSITSSTGDVDLRQGGPPQKLPRLGAFPADVTMTTPPSAIVKEDFKNVIVQVSSKDVDLRQLPGSPGKKRASMERAEQPPSKKTKAEIFDALFGSEDVDLRQLPTAPVTVASSTPPHAPSPTPSSQDTPESDETLIEMKPRIDDDPRGWAKYKELKPDTYKSPRPFGQFRDLPSRSHILNTKSESMSPEHEPAFEGEPQPVFDRLGRRLLYHKLPDDPGERRRSLNTPLSPFPEMDTDMRPRPHLMDVDAINSPFNFNMIMAHAEEQLKNGTLSFNQYNLFIQQMIRMNEVSKLQEAQRRDELESKEAWEQRRRRRRLGSDDEQGDKSPVYSPGSPVNDSSDVNKQPQMSPSDMRFGDIDERFPGGQKTAPRVPPLGSMAPAPEPPPPHWNVNQPRWEPWQHRGPPPSSGPPQMRMMSPGVPYHCPEISSPSNFPVNRWRPPFQNRPNFDGDIENRFDRFSPRSGPGLRFPPSMPLTQQLQHQMQHPPPRITYPPMLVRDRELPPADAKLLEHILQDSMRTINIDGVPREIRFYGDTAIVMMTWDDPREISFQGNVKRRVTFDDRDSILCAINEGYRDFVLDGITHRIRIGAPTRELYIDGKWYECIFGGPPVNIEIGGKLHTVKLDGPQPQVKIGYARKDLVAGKINLIINAKTMVPVFLDAKPQRFDIEGKPHILRFVDALMRVMINGRPFPVEFGGLPKPILVRDKKHFIRFSVLPRWVRPGYVKIVNMEGTRLASPPPHLDAENSNSNMGLSGDESSNDGATDFVQGHKPALPILGNPVAGRGTGGRRLQDSVDTEQARGSPGHYHKDSTGLGLLARPPPTHRTRQGGQMPLEMLTSLMPATMAAPASGCSYQVEQDSQEAIKKPDPVSQLATSTSPMEVSTEVSAPKAASTTGGIPFLPVDVNIDELFKKLVASGIVPQSDAQVREVKKEEESNVIKLVNFKIPETLKLRQPGIVTLLYSGIQCSSCGVRFPPEQTIKYSQHLDWHFRQNRRDRDNTRKAQSRKWYYDVSDWIQFEEIEDLEERAQSWFETQQAAEGRPEDKEVQEIPSVSAGESLEDTFCDVCHDKFEQFYNEDREEWHLRLAVRVDGKTYHPFCYDDYKASLESAADDSSVLDEAKGEDKVEEGEAMDENEEGSEIKDEVKDELIDTKADPTEVTKELTEAKTDPNEVKEELIEVKADPSEVKVEPTEAKEGTTEAEEPNEAKETEESIAEMVVEEHQLLEDGEIKKEVAADDDDQIKEIEGGMDSVTLETVENTDEPGTEAVKEEVESESKVVEEQVREPVAPVADTTHVALVSSIDGNVQFEDKLQLGVASAMPGKIKINITKAVVAVKELEVEKEGPTEPEEVTETLEEEESPEEECSKQSEPPPPGVDPVCMKSSFFGRKLTECPPVSKGKDISALCSIM
uniref:Pre-mRNA cleavage complex 2 protein Pcf11 n=1 Tax=Timema genevievae TaxID=629358 RepID=A0A7R9JWH8_TIMGE|nr:unnamed protein product [Timema genevievae]